MIDFTVIITHLNRKVNLENTLEGLNLQNVTPKKVIVVNMSGYINLKSSYGFILEIIQYPWEWELLPLSSARNLGAAQVLSGQLVFLDVDCIPACDYCDSIARASKENNALVMGTPKYLLSSVENELRYEWLRNNSIFHPSRPIVSKLRQEKCYELFWSLCFSLPAQLFHMSKGFDENYLGYGAEDTDFALTIKSMNIPFYLSEVQVYHQQHPIYVPPLNHLVSIVRNCNYYKIKWGYWPMEDCLRDFSAMNLINWSADDEAPVEIIRMPSTSQVERHLVANAPYR